MANVSDVKEGSAKEMQSAALTQVSVSAVAVTWNGKKYAQEYLQSLTEADFPGLEIIVVDNDSTDGTPEFIAQEYPNVKLIQNGANLGFAKATNIGIEASKGKYICLINSDVVLIDGCLSQLLHCMEDETNKDVGVIGPQMLAVTGEVRRSTMRFPTLWNSFCRALAIDQLSWLAPFCQGQLMADFDHDRSCDVEVLNGWFWMARREALEEVGNLDPRFFMYGEDLDWCFRFWKRGWRVLFCPEAKAIHYGGASSSAAPERFYVEMQRANLQYWVKHHGYLSFGAYYCVVCMHEALRLLGHVCLAVARPEGSPVHSRKAKRSWAALEYLLNPTRVTV
jgi:GT2 family glycosyltransferase